MNQLRSRVIALVKKGAFDAAVTAAAEYTRRNPRDPEGYELLAQAEEVAGYIKAAINSISRAIALAPNEPPYIFHRGRLYLQINAAQYSMRDLNRVLELVKLHGNAEYIAAVVSYRDEALRRVQAAPKVHSVLSQLQGTMRAPVAGMRA